MTMNEGNAMYTAKDFETIYETDIKANYTFKSKDGYIEANFFFEKGNVETRGLIHGTDEIIHIVYPFANPEGHSELPDTERILDSIIRRLKEMGIKKREK